MGHSFTSLIVYLNRDIDHMFHRKAAEYRSDFKNSERQL